MQHKRPPAPVIVLIIIAVLAGGYYGIRALNDGANDHDGIDLFLRGKPRGRKRRVVRPRYSNDRPYDCADFTATSLGQGEHSIRQFCVVIGDHKANAKPFWSLRRAFCVSVRSGQRRGLLGAGRCPPFS